MDADLVADADVDTDFVNGGERDADGVGDSTVVLELLSEGLPDIDDADEVVATAVDVTDTSADREGLALGDWDRVVGGL